MFNYISVKQENAGNCDDFKFDEILWARNKVSI